MRNILFVLFCCVAIVQSSAEKHCVFTPIDAANGLSGNKVRNITQLPDGRMMITTDGLLNLYDGTTFNYLHYNRNHILSLSAYSGFHHEYIDAHGYMWLKNQYKLMVVDSNKERFIEHPDSLLALWGVKSPLKDFFMDKSQNLWVVTEADELHYIDKQKLKSTSFLSHVSSQEGRQDLLLDLMVLEKKLYLFYRSGLLICYDITSRKEFYRQNYLKELPDGYYGNTSYVLQGNQTFYQLCNGNRGGVMLSYDVAFRKWTVVLQTDYWLNYLSIDKDNSIWVSCPKGLWNISKDFQSKQFIPTLQLVDGRSIDTEVSTLYNDNQGGMWVGTLNRGILYYHPDRFRFQNIGASLFPSKGQRTINVTCFSEMKDGSVLVGTEEGLFCYDGRKGEIHSFGDPLRSICCNALMKDSQQRIWVGSWGQGLYCIQPTGNVTHYNLPCNTVYSIIETPQHEIYLGTSGCGFGRFDPSDGSYRQLSCPQLSDVGMVWQLSALGEHSLVGVTHNGWFTYDLKKKEGSFTPNLHTYSSVCTDRRNRVWTGSQDGLQMWDEATGQKQSFYTNDGLVNNSIQSVIQASDGSMWVSTSGGITRIDADCSFANYNQFDGVLANEFCERAVYEAADGTLYWGGINGFNKLVTHHTVNNKVRSIPLFVDFHLFSEQIEYGVSYDNNVVLRQPITLTKEICLNYDQNFFTLDFSALNYVNPTQTYYRYQLSGIDNSEREVRSADGRGSASYTDLAPGTYIFRVRATDNSGNWNDQYAEMKIIVKAPFWKTTAAFIFYVFLLIGSITGGTFLYLRRKKQKLIREQKEKLDAMKSTFLQNMNEELTGPLLQIVDPLNKVLQHIDEGRTRQQLKEIQNSAMDLKDLVEQLSEGALSPLAANENELNMEALLFNMRRMLEMQKERKEQSLLSTDEAEGTGMSVADEAFIHRVLQHVEEHMEQTDYSVEMLSKDLGMDRTGLYRKLVSILGKSPTTFIRSIRLKRAAQLLEEGHTVAEVADRVGFSTSSYLSKCFQEEYGMRPLQYVNSLKKPNNK